MSLWARQRNGKTALVTGSHRGLGAAIAFWNYPALPRRRLFLRGFEPGIYSEFH